MNPTDKKSAIGPLKRPITEAHVSRLLDNYGIDYSKWGKDTTTYPLSRLVQTLNEDEVTLGDLGNGLGLGLNTWVVIVTVRYNGKHGHLTLFEKLQYFHGSRKKLKRVIEDGIGETLKQGEDPEDGARRGLAEELGQTEPGFKNPACYGKRLIPLQQWENSNGKDQSRKWPGLAVIYHRQRYLLTIDDNVNLYHNEYKEVVSVNEKPYKTITFGWKKCHPV